MTDMGMGGMGSGLAGAQCAIHPDQPAMRTCTRCGSFMCSMCAEGGAQTLCPACQQRMGMSQSFPLTRDNWTFSELWDYCFEIFKREWVMLSVGVLLFFVGVSGAQLVTGVLQAIGGGASSDSKNVALSIILSLIGMVVQQVVQGVLGLGLMRMMFDTFEGQKPDVGRLLSQFSKLGTLIVTLLLVTLLVAIPFGIAGALIAVAKLATGAEWSSLLPAAIGLGVVAFIPLIYFLIPLYLMQAEIAYNDNPSPIQTLRNCYAYARDQRLSIFGVSLVGGLVVMAGLLACCVGILPGMAMNYLLIAGLYRTLRSGSEVES